MGVDPWRAALGAAGLGAVGIGIAAIGRPELAVSMIEPAIDALETLAQSDLLPALVAVLLLLLGIVRAAHHRLLNPEPATGLRPEVERAQTGTPIVGGDLDRELGRLRQTRDRSRTTDGGFTDRLRPVAEAVLVAYTTVDDEGAQQALATGTWTDDRIAAAYLSGEEGPRLPLSRRLYAWLYPGRALDQHVGRTVAELQRIAGQTAADDAGEAW